MNSKMTTNSPLSTNLKNKTRNKLSKQPEEEQNHRYGDHMEGYQWGRRKRRMGEWVEGLRSVIGRYKMDGEIKNSIGNREAKELMCMTHRHELTRGVLEGKELSGGEGRSGKQLRQL